MIKILHTGDWHIGQFDGPTDHGENCRFLDICGYLETLVNKAYDIKPNIAIVAGDVFHQAKVWSDRGLKESRTAIRFIRTLSEICPIVVMRGTPNHDSEQQFEMLKTAFQFSKNVKIVTEPKVLKYAFHGELLAVACLPGFDRGYFRAKNPGLDKTEENEVFSKYLDTLIKGLKATASDGDMDTTVLVSHYTIDGANMESGQTAFFGQFEPCVSPATLQAADFDLSLFGHIHNPQKVDNCPNTFYCGAVSALNFNDEGQERGFYVHEVDGKKVGTEFYPLPTREFCTIRMKDEDIAEFNSSGVVGYDLLRAGGRTLLDDVQGKIVRVLYNCTDEHNKVLSKKLMEKLLYDAGAFWVKEISPQKITVTVSKHALKDDDTPENNLAVYLEEKGIPDVDATRIIERALPIIQQAQGNSLKVKKTGAFIPMQIAVKNYRNYREEAFDFDDIRFCTINGENGAGKSSLFMDAIIDCLYEETREGDIGGWISNDPDARSGSIQFTFSLGDAIYRVTRTRMKSGKATLNLSEKVDDEWADRSCEKMKDTQQEILNTIGMDSLTLKATALIMQDQYGLFLTADKGARMEILASILGLGDYSDMEDIAGKKLADTKRDIRLLKEKVETLLGEMPDEEELTAEIEAEKASLKKLNAEKQDAEQSMDGMKLALSVMDDAAARMSKADQQIASLTAKKASTEVAITMQNGIICSAEATLWRMQEIGAGVAKYKAAVQREKELLGAKGEYDVKKRQLDAVKAEKAQAMADIASLEQQKADMQTAKLFPAQQLLKQRDELKTDHQEYERISARIAELENLRPVYEAAQEAVRDAQAKLNDIQAASRHEIRRKEDAIEGLRKRARLINENNCPYVEEVRCAFLKDALEAKSQIDGAEQELEQYKAEMQKAVQDAQEALVQTQKSAPEGYKPEEEQSLKHQLLGMEDSEKKYRELAVARANADAAQDAIKTLEGRIDGQHERVAAMDEDIARHETELDAASASMMEYDAVVAEIKANEHFVEDEKALPVADEQKRTAEARVAELKASITELDAQIAEADAERKELQTKTIGSDILLRQYDEQKKKAEELDEQINQVVMSIGRIQETQDAGERRRDEAAGLMEQSEALGVTAADLDLLKTAFSQDGIPHNIVRSVIPIFEATATNILGQMSGGHMSVEFVMEKTLKSNSKKEVTTLDVIINDSVTGRLPYMSRSGGERVKSALAVILALAEIKSTKAGVQPGFLFIDEPPFLDEQGTTAYCDALETIQCRYSDLKVMAITHDVQMKARFLQSVDVIKTDDGSKVIKET